MNGCYCLLAIGLLPMLVFAIDWNDAGNVRWAHNCDFFGNDLVGARSTGEECGGRCEGNAGCSHFTWTNFEGGTCWMKQGGVSEGSAQWKDDQGAVCGYVKRGPVGPDPPVNPPTGNGFSQDEFNRATAQYAAVQGGSPFVPSANTFNLFNQYSASLGHVGSKAEAAALLAQMLWESAGLTAREEWDRGAAIGQPRFYGRGYIQLSYEDNYRKASQAIFGDDRLVSDPDQVANNEEVAMQTACWYWGSIVKSWNNPNMDFGTTTRAINGALECNGAFQEKARKRWVLYTKVCEQIGVAPLAERGCYN